MDGWFAFGLFAGFVTWIVLTAKKEEMSRIVALILVFVVVIFFWMSFHQNGLTLTFFARDYSAKVVNAFTNLFFNVFSLLAVCGAVAGAVILVRKKLRDKNKSVRWTTLRSVVRNCIFQVHSCRKHECYLPGNISVIQSFICCSADVSCNGILCVA